MTKTIVVPDIFRARIPGVILVACVALLATAINASVPYIAPLMAALLLGMLMSVHAMSL